MLRAVSSSLYVNPVKAQELQREGPISACQPMIMPLEGTIDEAVHYDIFQSIGVTKTSVISRAQRISARLDMAAKGIGVCLAPSNLAEPYVREGQLERIEGTYSPAYRYQFDLTDGKDAHVGQSLEFLSSLLCD